MVSSQGSATAEATEPGVSPPGGDYDVNRFAPDSSADLAAEIQLSHMRVHKAVARRIQELAGGAGLSEHEIASSTGYPLHLISVVLRGAPPRDTK